MPKPVLSGSPIKLKNSGPNLIWIGATNVAVGDEAKILRGNIGGLVIYSGVVNKVHPTRPFARLRLTRSALDRIVDEEVIAVTITITNAAGTGSTPDEVIIDDIAYNQEKKGTKSAKSSKKAGAKSAKKASGKKAAPKKAVKKKGARKKK